MVWRDLRDLVFPETVRAALGLRPRPPRPDDDGGAENDGAPSSPVLERANPRFS